MRKIGLLILSMVVAVAAQAGPQIKMSHTIKSKATITNKMVTKADVKGDMRTAVLKTKEGVLRAPITEQPEGEVVKYRRSGECIYASSGLAVGEESGLVTIVYGEGDKVYIQDLLYGLSGYYGGVWIEGNIKEDKISVPVGQSVYWSDEYQADVVIAWGSTYVYTNDSGGNSLGVTVDGDVTEITYTIDKEAKTISLEGGSGDVSATFPDNYAMTGVVTYWTDDYSVGGFAACNSVFTEFDPSDIPTVITEQPEGDLYTYYRSGDCIASSWYYGIYLTQQDGKINVVLNGDKAYIQNPLWWCDSYDTWVEGTYDAATGIITIPTGQYIYYNEESFYGIQVMWGYTETYESGTDDNGDPEYSMTYGLLQDEAFEFQIEGDMIKLLNCKGDAEDVFPYNYNATGLLGVYSDDQSFITLEFNTQGQMVNLVPAVPADPTADDWYDCEDESGFSKFYFTLPTTDVDGNMLDPEYLSYSIFIDNDELFTFPAEDYTFDLTEDITEVPYDLYSNAVDFHDYFVYFYRTNAEGYEPLFKENIGIQVYYTVNGVKNASNIVYLYEKPVETKYYVVGGFNDWNTDAGEEITEEGATITVEAQDLADPVDTKQEFKLITPAEDGGWTWIGGISENEGVEYFDVTDEMIENGQEITLYAGPEYKNFRLPAAGTYIIKLIDSGESKADFNSLRMVVEKKTVTAINDVNTKSVKSVKYVNIAGMVSDKPFDGVNVVVTTMTDGSTVVSKVIK